MGSFSRRVARSAFGISAAALLWPAWGLADTDPCDSLMPAAIGGPLLPKTSETAVFRWLANANYELDYRGQVFRFDASFGSWIDLGIEPLLEKIRDEMPDTRFVAPLYRSPICVATGGPQRGTVAKSRY
jgi:hypothetical protein